jgi:ankyrin repeat protein
MAVFDKDPVIYKKTFNLLLQYGAHPNSLNKDGWAPIHLAIKKGNTDAIFALL